MLEDWKLHLVTAHLITWRQSHAKGHDLYGRGPLASLYLDDADDHSIPDFPPVSSDRRLLGDYP